MVAVGACIDGTRGSGVLSSTCDVLEMSVVVGGVCDICLCLARGCVGGEGGEWIGFGVYQSCGNRGSVGRVSVFWLRWCGWFRWGVGRGIGPGSGGVGWCYVCLRC